jgi:phosphatidylserine/phosphatidylglycerophosphate/cardiolipin synthase-like enzyme
MFKKIVFLLVISFLYAQSISLYFNTPLSYPHTKSSTSFGDKLKELINNSKKEICFAIYGFREQNDILEALINAKKRGVKIKGVVDSNTNNQNYYKDTFLLYRYFDIKDDKQNYIMHNKFFIFDKKIVFSGSANISNTGTGGYNANSVIVIDDKKVASVFLKEFNQMFYQRKFHTKKEKITFFTTIDNSKLNIFFSPKSNTYQNGIKPLIVYAKKYIYIPIFYLTHKDLTKELIKAKKRGVDVRVIIDASSINNKYSKHKTLRKNNIKVKVENFGGKMHIKSIIVDDEYFVVGSMNFTKSGNRFNDENTIIVRDKKLAIKYKDYFLKLWNQIPNKYLYSNAYAEGLESGNSCFDGIDNDFDGFVDAKDRGCKFKYDLLSGVIE